MIKAIRVIEDLFVALYYSKTTFPILFLWFTSRVHYLIQLRLWSVHWIRETSSCFPAYTIHGSLYFHVSKLYVPLYKSSIALNLNFIGPFFNRALFSAKNCEIHYTGSGISPLQVGLCSCISDRYLEPWHAISDDSTPQLQYWACRGGKDFDAYAFTKLSGSTLRPLNWALTVSNVIYILEI